MILSVISHASVAQLDRVSGFEPGGRGFESLRTRQNPGYVTAYFFNSKTSSFLQITVVREALQRTMTLTKIFYFDRYTLGRD